MVNMSDGRGEGEGKVKSSKNVPHIIYIAEMPRMSEERQMLVVESMG